MLLGHNFPLLSVHSQAKMADRLSVVFNSKLNVPHIKNKSLNFLYSTPQHCISLWVLGSGELSADEVVQYNRPIRRECRGGSAPQTQRL